MSSQKPKCIVVVGGTGTGKTTYIKTKLLDKVRVANQLVFDVNNEYKGYSRAKTLDKDKFVQLATATRNKLIVFEEATMFFSNTGIPRETMQVLVRKRHNYNTLVWVFHSLRQVPLDILDLTDFLVLGKTADNAGHIYSKFKHNPQIVQAFDTVDNSNSRFYKKVVRLL